MPKYRKKPVVVEAIQFDGWNWRECYQFMSEKPLVFTDDLSKRETILIETLEGSMIANFNDYIIKGVQGEYYPCKPDIFEQTYDLIPSKPYYDIIGNRVEVLLDGVWQKATIVNGYRTHDGIINAKRDNGEGFGCGAARHDEFVRPIEGETKYEE